MKKLNSASIRDVFDIKMSIEELLLIEEGLRSKPYLCSEGYPTIGIGTKIGPKGANIDLYQFSVTERSAMQLLLDELGEKRNELMKLDWFVGLDSTRADIVLSMAYQIGVTGLLKFKKMIAAIEGKNWKEAANQALDSLWAKQTPERAERHATVLLTGDWATVGLYRRSAII